MITGLSRIIIIVNIGIPANPLIMLIMVQTLGAPSPLPLSRSNGRGKLLTQRYGEPALRTLLFSSVYLFMLMQNVTYAAFFLLYQVSSRLKVAFQVNGEWNQYFVI